VDSSSAVATVTERCLSAGDQVLLNFHSGESGENWLKPIIKSVYEKLLEKAQPATVYPIYVLTCNAPDFANVPNGWDKTWPLANEDQIAKKTAYMNWVKASLKQPPNSVGKIVNSVLISHNSNYEVRILMHDPLDLLNVQQKAAFDAKNTAYATYSTYKKKR